MASYNKYTGTFWESTSTPLILSLTASGTYSFSFTEGSLLENLKDNESAYIIPKYLRDATTSLWYSIPFRETTPSGSDSFYIGIDSAAPNRNLDINKILIGKRSYSGTQSYTASTDIMTSDLLNSDIDIYFYNTKPDTESQIKTSISFLTGTEKNINRDAPYIQSQIISSPGGSQSPSIDFIAMSGDIYFTSRGVDYFGNDLISGDSVYINQIPFPTFASSSSVNTDNNTLVYQSGDVVWEKLKYPTTSTIGISHSLVNIFGSDVKLNGFSLEFTDYRYSTYQVGDIQLGTQFNKMSISDVLRKIIYPYLPPACSVKLSNGQSEYLEVGTYPIISLDVSLTKRSLPTKRTRLINMIPGSISPITTSGQTTSFNKARGVVITPLMATASTFTVKATDGDQTTMATTSVYGIYPYFFGITSSTTANIMTLSSISKRIEPFGDKKYDFVGSGNMFFIYDYDYGPLTSILDADGNNIISSFSSTIRSLSSPTGLWASKKYRIYQMNDVPQIGPPSENYEFKY
jgi:hypothetical protein